MSYDIRLINRHPCLDSVPRCLIQEDAPEIIATNLGDINNFEWTVGSVKDISIGFDRFVSSGSNYKIQVCEKNRNICDTSDKTFSITNKETLCKSDGGIWYKGSNVCEINSLTESQCIAKGGKFNECASSCRHINSTGEPLNCTLECVQTCTFDFNI